MPFMWKPKKVILVGDHKQLRATILQTQVGKTQFDQSLFERLAYSEDTTKKVKVVKPGIIVRRLIYQYRMHSSIREFPSWRWYESQLTEDKNFKERPLDSALSKLDKKLKRFIFFDLENSKEKDDIKSEGSKRNVMEVKCTFYLIQYLANLSGEDIRDFARRVAIITPYQGQIRMIKEDMKYYKLSESLENSINTVDSF